MRMYAEKLEMLIDGTWVQGSSGATAPLVNPADGSEIAAVPHATRDDLDRALGASARAFRDWKITTAAYRWQILSRAADLIEARKANIARTLTLENGKALAEAVGEVQFCADATRWYAEEAKRTYGRIIPSRATGVRQMVFKEPVGPALGFAAWNFPAGNVTLKMAAALAAGCSIIVKPSDETPGTAVAIGRCFQDAGVPAGALNIVFGPPAAISEHLIASPIPKKVSLTGSTPVGKLLQRLASETLKRCTMELGGHAPVIVFDDADMEKALDVLIAAKFRNAGQVCTSPTRFYIQENVYERFTAGFVERSRRIVVGNGLDEATQMGPLITERRLDMMDAFVRDAVEKGASVTLGGQRLDRKGYFYAPTVLKDVTDDARVMSEEPFGPLAQLTPFKSVDEVIARANSLPFGLAAYLFTTNGSTASAVGEALEAGVVGVNHTSVHEPETPFGGVNESGYGAESGIEGLEAYLRTKMISEKRL
ncbi:NAD-dependent succinate-semialdehyde dehydrogenase [Agrobacterium rhizogenes]|uniref:NAD-dependent succinate-semialdehyde dehydrogenase n=1 Tax=Rhizobium rhizogenes TaxID=359 RepID=UPI0015736DBD|nr:NAD-dependent succinate-semialdehyde dehydrogenase [Rhizobium rhizogenes]NTF59533.1 NAD-dependent succinate-semialdehyde dehydrogenase [Rhizobium rhizogenes]NTF79093.1 NAD-dependent succinate-semialdehyde dehydrogenase [Rhizobium rhizogenes]NTG18331.1 NAD-dependent succinate-semialdehyde dehydrogenase [Rhizobium rhizogenes]NTH55485.1 NAD-dependent succinate-semialdehyde dehydrogenase [Rhizobium rhizogenes]NTH75068.1 NAD-dependent succinate-semialdehyde dehydrogenase [Rhizobium rhizogenes]